jgi:AraC-like DNA-binding protein
MAVLRDETTATTGQFFALWQAIEAASGDPAIGFRLAKGLDSTVMPLAFVAAHHARDFRDGLQRAARFKRLCAPEEVTIAENGETTAVVVGWPHAGGTAAPPALIDATMVAFLELGRHGTGAAIAPLKVELTGPERARADYEAYFGCAVRFRARVDRIVFKSSDLDRPFLTYNKDLLEVLGPELDRRLEKQSVSDSVSEQIRWVLRRRLTAGRPDIKAVASELALSERSLQRKLTDEGVTFQSLVSDTRHHLALEYLADPALALMEVAYMLGYEDQNSFFRAFRLWEHKTPSEWRMAQTPESSTGRGIL